MCQLLGISSVAPTQYSNAMLEPFCQRGGTTDIHKDGWGLAYYINKDWNIINETNSAATSAYANEIIKSQSHLETTNLICHIRYATIGDVSMSNVHPFKKNLFGSQFVFAHNGDVPMFDVKSSENNGRDYRDIYKGISASQRKPSSHFQPIGETDSEHVFCTILNHLQSTFDNLPSLPELYFAIHEICTYIAEQHEGTILNFLLGIGEVIFAFSWPGSRKGSTTWNGLHYTLRNDDCPSSPMSDRCYSDELESSSDDDSVESFSSRLSSGSEVAVITTKPLTDDSSWTEFKKGDLLLFVNGKVISSENLCELDGYILQ